MEIQEATFNSEAPPAKFLARLEAEAQEVRQHFAATSVEDYARATKQSLTEQNRAALDGELARLQRMSLEEAKFEWFEKEALFPYFNLKLEHSELTDSDAWRMVLKICFVAHYADGTRIYLTALQAAPHSRNEASEVRRRCENSVPDAAVAAKMTDAQPAVLETQVAKLLPIVEKLVQQHTELQASEQKKTQEAVRQILAESKPVPVEREIIDLYWGRNFSQDRIVEELRKQGRGKSKKYVGGVIHSMNQRLEAKKVRGKLRVSGPALPPTQLGWEGDGKDAGRVQIDAQTPASQLEQKEFQNAIERWDSFSPKIQNELLKEFHEMKEELRRRGKLVEKPNENRNP